MKNIGVICGGFSSEFDISVKSGRNIQENLPDDYKGFLILLRKEGWTVQMEGEEIMLDSKLMSFEHRGERIFLDAAIVYIHGDPGEDGKVQAYLDMIDFPYVNSGPLASQLSFDKWYCNQFLKGFGVQVAQSEYLTDSTKSINAKAIADKLGLPIFVKPCDSGSSYGISKVHTVEELPQAINAAFEEGETVVLEAFLAGTEVTCGVYRNKEGIQALPLTEIVSDNDFFDFKAKYQGESQEITPARVSETVTTEVQRVAKEIYQLLNLRSVARIDFMLVDDVPHVIEVNTTPGFSNESIVPKMIAAANMSTKEFWQQILEVEL